MKKNLLLMLTAMLLSMAVWSCSDDDNDMVSIGFTDLEYRHMDFEKLPQPVQDEAKRLEILWSISKGLYNGQEAYMIYGLSNPLSSFVWWPVIYADGTKVPFDEVNKGVKAGIFDNWVCVYHESRDKPINRE